MQNTLTKSLDFTFCWWRCSNLTSQNKGKYSNSSLGLNIKSKNGVWNDRGQKNKALLTINDQTFLGGNPSDVKFSLMISLHGSNIIRLFSQWYR